MSDTNTFKLQLGGITAIGMFALILTVVTAMSVLSSTPLGHQFTLFINPSNTVYNQGQTVNLHIKVDLGSMSANSVTNSIITIVGPGIKIIDCQLPYNSNFTAVTQILNCNGQTLVADFSGAHGNLGYGYYGYGTESSFTYNISWTPKGAIGGVYSAAGVVDAAGNKSAANTTKFTILNGTVSPITTKLVANRTFISADQGVKLTNNTSGGTGVNTYSYTVNSLPGFHITGNKIFFTKAGTYTVTLNVTDNIGQSATSFVVIKVTPALVTVLSANILNISADQIVAFTNVTTGGTGGDQYAYTIIAEGGSGSVVRTGNLVNFTSSGVYNVTLTVTDLTGEVATSTVQITVKGPLTTVLFANRTIVSSDQSVLLENTTFGGTGNNTYSYRVNGEGGYQLFNNTITFTGSRNFTIMLTVRDKSGEVARSNLTIDVAPALQVTLNADNTSVSTGQTVILTNITHGGTGSNVFNYTVNASGSNFTGNNVIFTSPGTYNVTIHAKDFSGETANSTVTITVTQPPLTCQDIGTTQTEFCELGLPIGANWNVTYSDPQTKNAIAPNPILFNGGGSGGGGGGAYTFGLHGSGYMSIAAYVYNASPDGYVYNSIIEKYHNTTATGFHTELPIVPGSNYFICAGGATTYFSFANWIGTSDVNNGNHTQFSWSKDVVNFSTGGISSGNDSSVGVQNASVCSDNTGAPADSAGPYTDWTGSSIVGIGIVGPASGYALHTDTKYGQPKLNYTVPNNHSFVVLIGSAGGGGSGVVLVNATLPVDCFTVVNKTGVNYYGYGSSAVFLAICENQPVGASSAPTYNFTVPSVKFNGHTYIPNQTSGNIKFGNETTVVFNTSSTCAGPFSGINQAIQCTPPFTFVSLNVSAPVVDVGQTEALTATVSGGVSPYSYNFLVYNNSNVLVDNAIYGGVASTSNTFAFTVQPDFGTGNFSVDVFVTDSASQTVNDPKRIIVHPAPTVQTLSLTSNGIAVPPAGNVINGQFLTITEATFGGTSPYTFNFIVYNSTGNVVIASGPIANAMNTNSFSFNTGFIGIGNYTTNATATDSAHVTVNTLTDSFKVIQYHTSPPGSASNTTVTTTVSPGGGSGSGGGGGGGPNPGPVNVQVGSCMILYNMTQLETRSITLNSNPFTVTENYITPTSAGVSVNGNSYALALHASQPVGIVAGTSYTIALNNITFVPIQDTVTLALCGSSTQTPLSAPNATANNSTITTSVISSTSTATTSIAPPTTTIKSHSNNVEAPANLTTILGGNGGNGTDWMLYLLSFMAIFIAILSVLLSRIWHKSKHTY